MFPRRFSLEKQSIDSGARSWNPVCSVMNSPLLDLVPETGKVIQKMLGRFTKYIEICIELILTSMFMAETVIFPWYKHRAARHMIAATIFSASNYPKGGAIIWRWFGDIGLIPSWVLTSGWWFGTWIQFFHSVGNVIIPTDFHVFQGWNHQPLNVWMGNSSIWLIDVTI